MLKNTLKSFKYLPGWKSSRKIVVIESDDWGSLRAPTKDGYKYLIDKGLDLKDNYNKYDTLATPDDLSALFETLTLVQDKTGRNAVMTALAITANPVFSKIKESNYRSYFYEPFTETLKRIPGCEKSFDLWKEGISKKIFVPQFHGREHLNVQNWLRALQKGEEQTLLAFDEKIWGFNNKSIGGVSSSYLAAFDLINRNDLLYQETVLNEGLNLFEKLFGYKATFFVAPNGPFSNSLLQTTSKNGIKFVSFASNRIEPLGSGKNKRRFHYLGQKLKYDQTVLIRNCVFEPHFGGKDWVDSCLNEISTAFKWKKPAIISTHRLNFISSLDKPNRDNNLREFKSLLYHIRQKWPDVEFMSSDQLGDLIAAKKLLDTESRCD